MTALENFVRNVNNTVTMEKSWVMMHQQNDKEHEE